MSAEAHLEVYRRFQGSLREHPLRFWPIWTTRLGWSWQLLGKA